MPYLNPNAHNPRWGWVGAETEVRTRDADDHDWAWAVATSQTGIDCQVQRDGELVAWAFLQPQRSNHDGYVVRECGLDHGVQVIQDVYLRFAVLNLQSGRWDTKYVRFPAPHGDAFELGTPSSGERAWNFDRFSDAATIDSGNVVFSGPYRRGNWIRLDVGLVMWHYFTTNDFYVRSKMDQSYRILEEHVMWTG